MIKRFLKEPCLVSLLNSPLFIAERRITYGIMKDKFGYPVRKQDPETEEPVDSKNDLIRKAPYPSPAPPSGYDVKSNDSIELYKAFLESDRRSMLESFVRQPPDFSELVKPVEFREGMKRIGLIGRKHGESVSFLRNGEKVVSTLVEIQDNYVMSCQPTIYHGKTDYLKMKLAAFDVPTVEDVPLVKQKEYLSVGISPKQVDHEFIVTAEQALPVNFKLDISHFFVGQYLDVAGLTMNRGFQGVVRRWGYKGQSKIGPGKTHRRPGSISTQGLARVLKGKKMPGIMGNRPFVTRDVQILYANYEKRYILVQGHLQGIHGCYLFFSDSVNKDPIQGPLLHCPTFLGHRTDMGQEIYDRGVIDPTESFDDAYNNRVDKRKRY